MKGSRIPICEYHYKQTHKHAPYLGGVQICLKIETIAIQTVL